MTSQIVSLSSNAISSEIIYPEIYLNGRFELTLDACDVYTRNTALVSLKINWGDGADVQIYKTNFFKDTVEHTNFYGILKEYKHEYLTSTETYTKKLTCQTLATYYDGSSCRFIQPITIYTPSFYEKVDDLALLGSNIIDIKGSILYTFHTKRNNGIVEWLKAEEEIDEVSVPRYGRPGGGTYIRPDGISIYIYN